MERKHLWTAVRAIIKKLKKNESIFLQCILRERRFFLKEHNAGYCVNEKGEDHDSHF